MSKTKQPERVPVDTPVGTRLVRPDQPWWKGEGRGHTREFIEADHTFECDTCHENLAETAFPTLTVPRKDGRTRGRTCRECVAVKRETARKKAKRSAAARKAAAQRRKAA